VRDAMAEIVDNTTIGDAAELAHGRSEAALVAS
jgi:hypothetical protein